jgi:hypothetical protein
MPGMALGDIASWCRLYLVAEPSHVGVDVDELSCPLHHPMACCRQTKDHGFLSGMVLSCDVVVGDDTFSGGAKPLGLDI